MFRLDRFTHNWTTSAININEIGYMYDEESADDGYRNVVRLDESILT